MSGIHLELDKHIVAENRSCDFVFSKSRKYKKVKKGCNESDNTDFLFYQGGEVENHKMTINWDRQSPQSLLSQ